MNLFLASIIPPLVILFFIFIFDTRKEPLKMLLLAFGGGILSILVSLCISTPLSNFEYLAPEGLAKSFYSSFFEAAIPEEIAKWLVFYVLIKKSKHFDQYYDGILYAIFISMGFALVENILYVLDSGIETAIVRSILSVPAHMLFAIPMGYFLSLEKFRKQKGSFVLLALSLFIPILLHGIFDFILFYKETLVKSSPNIVALLGLVFLAFDIFMWRYGVKRIKSHLKKDKNELA